LAAAPAQSIPCTAADDVSADIDADPTRTPSPAGRRSRGSSPLRSPECAEQLVKDAFQPLPVLDILLFVVKERGREVRDTATTRRNVRRDEKKNAWTRSMSNVVRCRKSSASGPRGRSQRIREIAAAGSTLNARVREDASAAP
jgi:hypothetical protein